MKTLFITILLMLVSNIRAQNIVDSLLHVQTGLDVLVQDHFSILQGKRVGLITNHTGLTKDGRHIADVLHKADNVTLAALFGPEHGIRGKVEGGEAVESNKDPLSGVPVYSLYGKNRQPTAEMLTGIDMLVFDIQDVGARFYTYVSTMARSMEAAAKCGKTFIVLDRPNPINGRQVEGPLLREGFESFVGLYRIPVRHGMTVGELALMFKGQGWITGADSLDLQVIKMTGWQRNAWLDQTDVPWETPSPNMLTLQTAVVYPGICLIEGTNLSEGRGTDRPFEKVGAPWINAQKLAQAMNSCNLPGVTFAEQHFTPLAGPEVKWMKFRDQQCGGIFIRVTDRDIFKPVQTGVTLIWTIHSMYPQDFEWSRTINRLYGSDMLKNGIDHDESLQSLLQNNNQGLDEFLKIRESYLLY